MSIEQGTTRNSTGARKPNTGGYQGKGRPAVRLSPEEAAAAEVARLAAILVESYAAKRVRIGKTKKDHIAGAKAKNLQNRDTRAMWQGDSSRTTNNFPFASCNGHRNVYQYTGKGGATIYTRTASAVLSGKKR